MPALPSDVFAGELRSEGLRDWIIQLREAGYIHEGRGERTLQMWICSHLVQKFFSAESGVYRIRPIIIEERALQGDSDIGDIMLPSQSVNGKIDVWVEIKNHFGCSTLSDTQMKNLEKDFVKCRRNIEKGGLGVVLITMDRVEDAEAVTSPLALKYEGVQVVTIGRGG